MKPNVFFVSTQGQVRNVGAYIQQFEIKNSIVVILYTMKNTSSLKSCKLLLQEYIEEGLDIIQLKELCLPNKPTAHIKKNMKKIYESYEKLISDIEYLGIINTVNICNFNNHYVYIERICKVRNIKINLLEEGLGTYTNFLTNREEQIEKIDSYKVIDALVCIKKEIKVIFRANKSILRYIGIFFIRLVSLLIRVNLEVKIKDLYIPNKYKFGWIREFNEVCVCFPEQLKKGNIIANNFTKLNLDAVHVETDFDFDSIPKGSSIFINQKYGLDNKQHFKVLLDIFDDMGIENIIFKFHPKENIELNKEILDDLIEEYNVNIEYLEGIELLPVENIIKSKNIENIIGINSSAMVYAPMFNEDVQVISIAQRYIRKAIIEYKIPLNKLELLKRDCEEIMSIFPMKQV